MNEQSSWMWSCIVPCLLRNFLNVMNITSELDIFIKMLDTIRIKIWASLSGTAEN